MSGGVGSKPSIASGVAVACGLALLVSGSLAGAAKVKPGDPKTSLVSRQSSAAGGAGANDISEGPTIAANGRFVAFVTEADNLGGPIQTGANDSNVYVYDREKRRVQLVSRQSKSKGGAGADDSSSQPVISADGRFVAFETEADNLGGPLDPGEENIYIYDRKRKKVQLASQRSGEGGNGQSFNPSISADGRYTGFTTTADNLGGPLQTEPNDINVYVYDRERRRLELVSRQSGDAGLGGNADSFQSSLSASGRFVAFGTRATNLGGPLQTPDPNDNNVYVYDRGRNRVSLISRQSESQGGAGSNDSSSGAFISASGSLVAFESQATNLGGPIQTEVGESNIYVYDREDRRVTLVSRRSKAKGGAGANGTSSRPGLSRVGRFVAFETAGTNLGGRINPANTGDNVYLYDRKLKRVELVGRRSGRKGAGCNDSCEEPAVSASARFVAFSAQASNLGGPIDPGAFANVYVRDRGR